MTPNTFSPEALTAYASVALRYVFMGLLIGAAVVVVLGSVWGIRFWRTGA